MSYKDDEEFPQPVLILQELWENLLDPIKQMCIDYGVSTKDNPPTGILLFDYCPFPESIVEHYKKNDPDNDYVEHTYVKFLPQEVRELLVIPDNVFAQNMFFLMSVYDKK